MAQRKKKPEAPIGLEIGTKAPVMALITSTGQTVDYATLSGQQGLVLTFVRSLEWCPFCKKQIRLLNQIAPELAELGWKAASLTYDSPEKLTAFGEANSIEIPMISDEDSAVIDAFQLRNTRVKPGGRSEGVPHPAVVFIGGDGEIKAMLREPNYMKRPEPEAVVAQAKALSAG